MNEILIVEDDIHINALLKEALQKEGYGCTQAFSGTEARLLLTMNRYALVLLDLMLPGISGEDVLQEIRRQGQTPVIVLTAKDTIDVKVEFLKKGADDYVTKPFDIKEVLARIEVQLRKSTKEIQKTKISYQGMVLDKDTHQVFIDERELPKITKQEFSILELLLKHPKKVFSKEEIFEYAWEEVYMGETKTLDVHISNMRKKIKEVSDKEYIETVWGIGFRLHP
ncbi:response regulator transcription factor [Mediterraneibacter sp. NSJ-55]|uniref:Stage 0 sporulation protein A homolog n=1 Tax=Mediterraneibacter hominis TaxID=2763054 RepID=A0A923RPS0_9FIRM|nr:response regulator transcription factor [Mediterraneibacter hominis]MBC5687888.1 response regulator transcription factor [Mediterraneibacter hominis]